jgi:hypothetical protein
MLRSSTPLIFSALTKDQMRESENDHEKEGWILQGRMANIRLEEIAATDRLSPTAVLPRLRMYIRMMITLVSKKKKKKSLLVTMTR